MAEVSYDARSFSIDGRRVWLVAGAIHYARTPRGLWRDRIRAAKQAGLNCIETPVFWSAHEAEPDDFDFTGDLDLRAFVQLVGEEGLYCVLRPGPYVGHGWDFGGLPAYLHGIEDRKANRVKFRENEPQFMEAIDRYLRAVLEQVGDLQVSSTNDPGHATQATAPGAAAGGYHGEGGGPIIMMQVEHAWHSDHPEQGVAYLERLVSMLRQQGVSVPLTNANNLWQTVEGTIDTWSGFNSLPAMMRQLAVVRPESPPMVMGLGRSEADHATAQRQGTALSPVDTDTYTQTLAGLIGVGSQFNLSPFSAGTNFGFSGGRLSSDEPTLTAPANAEDAPLDEAGGRGPLYACAKRLCTFASHFGHVLAARESAPAPVAALDDPGHPAALMHQRGGQGEVVMLIKSAKDKSKTTSLMLPNGLTLNVPHAGQRAAWALLDTNLGGVANLDYTGLSPWAFVGRSLLVVFGPAGAQASISIDGQHHDITVPAGKQPTVIQGDPVHIAVLSSEQIDAAYLGDEGLVVGCDGLDREGKPIPLAGWGTLTTITPDGEVTSKRIKQQAKSSTPKLGKWQTLSLKPLLDGADDRYQAIDGPADMGALGQAFGYGWYRFDAAKADNGKALLAQGGDRLHLYEGGKLAALLGVGEGANKGPTTLKLDGTAVALADNIGRFTGGQQLGQDLKGLAGHLYIVKPIKPGKPELIKQPAGDPFAVVGLAHGQRMGVRPMSEAIAWTIKPEPRKPIIMQIDDLPQACVVSVNDEPIRFLAGTLLDGPVRLLLDPADDGPMTGGKNTIKLELLEPLAEGIDISKHVGFHQTTGQATPKDGWAFAPWSIPTADDAGWRAVPKTMPSQPAWFKASFNIESADAPLFLEPQGLSKGQALLNGHNLGRYFVQTREGKQVAPDQRLYLPEPWLKTDEPNELLIFDEHGRSAEKCRLVYR